MESTDFRMASVTSIAELVIGRLGTGTAQSASTFNKSILWITFYWNYACQTIPSKLHSGHETSALIGNADFVQGDAVLTTRINVARNSAKNFLA